VAHARGASNPGGWLTQAARNNALDRLRREKRYREKLALLPIRPRPHRSSAPAGPTSDCPSCSAAVTPLSPRTRSSL
jgi:DNA-directed RNA polymerase specialized sigma24 family protein